MPKMVGIAATKEIRKLWLLWPKIIAITAYAHEIAFYALEGL